MARLALGAKCGSPAREPPIGALRTSPKSCPLSSRLASAASPSPRAALPKNCRRVSVTIASSKGCIEFSVLGTGYSIPPNARTVPILRNQELSSLSPEFRLSLIQRFIQIHDLVRHHRQSRRIGFGPFLGLRFTDRQQFLGILGMRRIVV